MRYPGNFLWGASTAGHQVDGGSTDQWTVWEHQRAEHLAQTAEKRLGWLPNWPSIAEQAKNPDNYIAGRGVDHAVRFREDFDILTSLNMNAFRCSIEWACLEPEAGHWDQAAIEHYRAYFAELRKRNITPIVTLWHWTMPVWFTQKGAFVRRKNIRYFERYVRKVMELFGNDLPYIITLNEPNVYATFSYLSGEWPPQAKNPAAFTMVYHNLMLAHRRAYGIIKQAQPDCQVGIAAQLADMRPTDPQSFSNKVSVSVSAYFWNWWFLNRIRGYQDFIGLNYYFTQYQNWFGKIKNPKEPASDLGWYMEPGGIAPLIATTWERYQKPIMVTENGLADAGDAQRGWWLRETMQALEKTLDRQIPVIGYLHWSLLDNFEWAYGWWPTFGLVRVDRATMRRIIRPSAQWFAEYIRNHSDQQ